jgi:hypothetical protein
MRTYVDVLMEIYKIKHENPSPERKAKIKLLKIVLKSYELSLKYQKSKEKIGYKIDFLNGQDLMSFFGAAGFEENENKIKYLKMKLKEIKTKDKTLKNAVEVQDNSPAEAE